MAIILDDILGDISDIDTPWTCLIIAKNALITRVLYYYTKQILY